MSGVAGIVVGHGCVLDDLQLMELEDVEWQPGDAFGFFRHLPARLSWKPQDEVDCGVDAPYCRAPDGIGGLGVGVATVEAGKQGVVGGFNSVFYENKRVSGQSCQPVQHVVADAVGASAYDKAHYAVDGESFFIALLQCGERGMGVGV